MQGIERFLVWAVFAITFAVAPSVAAFAQPEPSPDPQPGSVTAALGDVCGFVRAVFTNADPAVARITFSRNGKPFAYQAGSVSGGAAETIRVAAASGVALAGGLLLLARIWRRRKRGRTWAVAFVTSVPAQAVRTIGHAPSLSVRWTTHIGPGIHTLREDMAR